MPNLEEEEGARKVLVRSTVEVVDKPTDHDEEWRVEGHHQTGQYLEMEDLGMIVLIV